MVIRALPLLLALAGCQVAPVGSCTALDAEAATLEAACQYYALGGGVDVQLRVSDTALRGYTECDPAGWHCTITLGRSRLGPCVVSHEMAHARLWDAHEDGGADPGHTLPGWGAGECLYDEWSWPWMPAVEE